MLKIVDVNNEAFGSDLGAKLQNSFSFITMGASYSVPGLISVLEKFLTDKFCCIYLNNSNFTIENFYLLSFIVRDQIFCLRNL